MLELNAGPSEWPRGASKCAKLAGWTLEPCSLERAECVCLFAPSWWSVAASQPGGRVGVLAHRKCRCARRSAALWRRVSRRTVRRTIGGSLLARPAGRRQAQAEALQSDARGAARDGERASQPGTHERGGGTFALWLMIIITVGALSATPETIIIVRRSLARRRRHRRHRRLSPDQLRALASL